MQKGVVSCILLCLSVRLVLVLLFPQLGSTLDQSVQFSTPVTSFRSFQEGIFLLRHHLGLYDGGVVHLPPLLLQLMRFVGSSRMLHTIFIIVDCVIVWLLFQIESSLNGTSRCAWIFGVNPLTVLSCVSGSTVAFTYLSLIASIYFIVVTKNSLVSAAMMTITGYLDPCMSVLILPILNFIEGPHRFTKSLIYLMASAITGIYLYIASPFPLDIVYGTRLTFASVSPNMGLWWYFFIEMFEEFIPFFKAVFNLFSMGMIVPITLRFHDKTYVHPLHCWIVCLGWMILTKPYPTLGEVGIFLSMIPLFDMQGVSILKYMKYPMFTALLFMHGVLLSPIFYHLWIDLGSGNSNFFYAISLVYGLALGLLITDIMWGVIRLEHDQGKPNYSRKLTQV